MALGMIGMNGAAALKFVDPEWEVEQEHAQVQHLIATAINVKDQAKTSKYATQTHVLLEVNILSIYKQ